MSKSALYVLLALLSFWTLVIGLGDVFVFGAAARQFLSRNFAPTKGEIRVSKVTHRLLISAGITIEYSYTVQGRLYRGSGYRYDDQQSSIDAEEIVMRYPKWSAQTVYYNPNHPADSVLSTGVNGTDLLMVLFSTPMNVVLLLLWKSVLARLREKRGLPEAGGVRIRREKGRIRVRVDGISAWEAGVYALGAAAFAATFPLVVLGGFDPDVEPMILVWLAVLTVAAVAFGWKGIQNGSGRYDLFIDENSRAVTLPQTCGRQKVVTFSPGEIAGVCLLRRSSRLASGNYYSYLPALKRAESTTGSPRERLTAWGWSWEKAEGFSQWLCAQSGWEFKGVEEENPEAAG